MSKLLLGFLCLAVLQLANSLEAEQEKTDVQIVDSIKTLANIEDWNASESEDEDDEERAFWQKVFPPAFHLLKKVLRIEPLKCQHTTCSSCLAAFNKGGCFSVIYNRQAGPRATLGVELKSMSGRRIFGGSVNAGKPIPSCVNLHGPIKTVCLQDFSAAVGDSATPTGDVCFTINFRDYHLGVRFCALFTYGSFVPLVFPNIVKT